MSSNQQRQQTNEHQKIAFIGLGRMGGAMASNLARAGYNVYGWNRTLERSEVKDAAAAEVHVVPTLEEAVTGAAMILTCLNDAASLREVLFGEGGIVEYAPENALILDLATTGPQLATELAETLNTYNLRFADCPVTGGTIAAAKGTLTIIFGGAEDDFKHLQPLLNVIGGSVFYCGGVSFGQRVKAINQLLCAVNQLAVSEALILSEEMGLDPSLVIEVTKTGAAGSWALENLAPKVVENDMSPGFAIKHLLKDVNIALENVQTELPATSLAKTMLENAPDFEEGTQALIRAYYHRK